MELISTELKDCYLIIPSQFGDERGYFSPYYIQKELQKQGIEFDGVVQCNRSKSAKGVARGFHFQKPPKTQAKIVEVIAGAAIDIVIDLRKNSPTFKKSIQVLLQGSDNQLLYVPKGFAHGFVSLENNTIFQYLIDNDYAPELEDGVSLFDEELDLNWENIMTFLDLNDLKLSEKDKKYTPLKDRNIDF